MFLLGTQGAGQQSADVKERIASAVFARFVLLPDGVDDSEGSSASSASLTSSTMSVSHRLSSQSTASTQTSILLMSILFGTQHRIPGSVPLTSLRAIVQHCCSSSFALDTCSTLELRFMLHALAKRRGEAPATIAALSQVRRRIVSAACS